ncbi:MAG TPA: two-component regulator propeller domain-containing protein, partial [Chryseolinea sp.]|nr:two-component regulator propeller domain-containing protein [Chryseolinea sp.]
MNSRLVVSGIFLLLFFQLSMAQENDVLFTKIVGNNGETLFKITAITQDTKGYMWFSGQNASSLFRYDGYQMISFKHDTLNQNSLGGLDLETVYADDDGKVWIGFNDAGMDQYDPATGIFKHYRQTEDDPGSLSSNGVTAIMKDHQGRLWVGTHKGLNQLDEKTGKFIHYSFQGGDPKSLSCDVVRTLYEDRQGTLWIGTGFPFSKDTDEGGLNRLERDGTFTRFLHDPKDVHSLLNNKVSAIFEDSRGVFWIGTSNDGIHIMDREKGTFERYVINPAAPDHLSQPPLNTKPFDHITSFAEDGNGAIWIITYASGINRYDPITKLVTHYEGSNGFPDRSGWRAYTSRDGVLWLSTQESNLFRVDPLRKSIRKITTGSPVLRFLEDKESLWIGTDEHGLLQFDSENKLIHQFTYNASDPSSLFATTVSTLFQNQEDTLWLGTHNGVGIYNKQTKRFSKFPLSSKFKDKRDVQIWNILQDSHASKWFATSEGMEIYNSRERSYKQYQPDSTDSGSISSNVLIAPLEDRSGVMWLGTANGINRLDRKSDRFSHYLEGIVILVLYEDTNGTLWAGTLNKGVYRFNKNENTFAPFFDPGNEINNAPIWGMIEDDAKNLWISTPSAIVKINPERTGTYTYGSKYGITPRSLAVGAIYKNRKGQILIGYDAGFYSFFPQELAFSPQPLNINVTDFFINNARVTPGNESSLVRPVDEVSTLSLEHDENNIGFSYSTFDYRAPEIDKYFTMLEGYDDVWREAVGEKTSRYFSVPVGTYVFRIKILNSDMLKAEKAITIQINPPWWNTSWAYSLYGLLFITGIFTLDRTRKHRIIQKERQKSQLKELEQAKEIEKAYTGLKATQAQLIQSAKMASLGELTVGIAHEIQNPLNFVNNFSELNKELIEELKIETTKERTDRDEKLEEGLISDIAQNLEKINHHGKRADAIVKGMLQHSRSSSGVNEPTDINALCDEHLRLSYHGLRAKDKTFNVTLKMSFDKGMGSINVIPQDIGRVILNILNNAFYAVSVKASATADGEFEPTVSVSTKKSPRGVLISIKDNGNGIPKEVLGKIFQP